MNSGILGRRNIARHIFVHGLGCPDLHALQSRCVDGRGAGQDAIVIARISLRLGQGLSAASRATVPIRVLGSTSVIRTNYRFRSDCHFVNRAIAEIDYFFRVAGDEIGIVAGMSGICTGAGVAGSECCCHCRVADGARPCAIADRLQPSIPSGLGQPHFHFYFRIGRWAQRCGNTTK